MAIKLKKDEIMKNTYVPKKPKNNLERLALHVRLSDLSKELFGKRMSKVKAPKRVLDAEGNIDRIAASKKISKLSKKLSKNLRNHLDL